MSSKIIFLFFLFFIQHPTDINCSNGLGNIREDYCEIYLDELGENGTCSIANNEVTTEDYQMKLVFLKLEINWTSPVFHGWNIFKICNETDYELVIISVLGVRSEVDLRLSPAVQYLSLLGIREISGYDIYLPSVLITEMDVHHANGPKMVTFKYLYDSTVNSVITNNYIRKTMNNTEKIKIYYHNTFEKTTLTMEKNIFHGKNKMSALIFNGLKIKGLTDNTFENLTSLNTLIFDNVFLKDLSFLRLVK